MYARLIYRLVAPDFRSGTGCERALRLSKHRISGRLLNRVMDRREAASGRCEGWGLGNVAMGVAKHKQQHLARIPMRKGIT